MQLKPKLKNRLIYYSSLINTAFSFFILFFPFSAINLYFDTISNKNNMDWKTAKKRQEMQSKLTMPYFIGSVLGSIISSFFANVNPRRTLIICKLCFAVSILVFILFKDIFVMMISRFFQGFFADFIHCYVQWYIYDISLPEHKVVSTTSLYVFYMLVGFFLNVTAYFDTGGNLYWRIIYAVPCISSLISVFITVFLTPDLNSIKYMIRNKGKEGTFEILRRVIEDEAARDIVNEDYELLKEEKNRYVKEDEVELLKGDEEEEVSLKDISMWKIMVFDFKAYKVEILHVFFILILGYSTVPDLFDQFSILFRVKNFDDVEAVSQAKKYFFFSTLLEFAVYSSIAYFKLNKKRKFSGVNSSLLYTFVILGLSFSYYSEKLELVLIVFFMKALFAPGITTSLIVYCNDVLPPSFVFMSMVACRGYTLIMSYIIPNVFRLEESSYQGIGLKFFIFWVVIVIANIIQRFYMIETDERRKIEIGRILRKEDLINN